MEQIPEEIAAFTTWLGPIDHVLEIGVRRGGTIRHWHQHATGEILGVDYFGKDSLGKEETLKVHKQLQRDLSPRYAYFLSAEEGSRDPVIIDAVADWLGEKSLDLLFIDGDHSYEGAKADLQNYAGFVKPQGGVIAFHDIVDSPLMRRVGHGVYRLWAELKKDYPDQTFEFIHGTNEWGGIGALRL